MSDYPTSGREQMHATGPDNELRPLTDEHFSALDQAVARTRPADAPDLRSKARQEVDRVHKRMEETTLEKFGRSPSLNPWEQANDAASVLLNRAQIAESQYIDASGRPGTPSKHVEQLWNEYSEAFVAWLSAATAGWRSAKTYRAEVARRESWSR